MKKAPILLSLFLGMVFLVSGQTPEPIDLILVLDTSSSMGGSYREVNEYVSGRFLKEFLRLGDTFHLISFSESSRLEISRRIEGVGDVETVIGRLFLMVPLDPYTDIAGALDYTERYVVRLPSSRPRKVVFVTDGEHNPKPGSSAEVLDSGALETRVGETAARLGRNGADFYLVRFPLTGSGPSSGRRSAIVQDAPPAVVRPPDEPSPPLTAQQPPDEPPPLTVQQPPDEPPPLTVQQPPDTPTPPPQAGQPSGGTSVSKGFNYVPLLIGLGVLVVLILGLIIFFMTRKLKTSPNRVMAYAADRRKDETEPAAPAPVSLPETEKPQPGGSLLLSLVVDDQNANIGRRNIHSLKAGDVYTIGGSRLDDYFIFLVPLPAHIGEVHFDGRECTFVPKKPQYFPEAGSLPVSDCIGKIIRVVSDKQYELTFHLERYEDPLDSLNRLLNSVVLPPKPPEKPPEQEKKS
ncbi:MAG: VWA domain-containing protein [Treponema sp.]|jgi:hypothetical protein|nr:VWA domain-containing protein [Treponema sp.]